MTEARWTELSATAELLSGYPFRAGVRNEPDGDTWALQIQDLASADADLPQSVVTLSNHDGRYDRYLLLPTDLLFQARGARHAVAVVRVERRAISLPGLYIIRPAQNVVLPDYLAWCLNHPRTQDAIAMLAQGTHQPFVPKQSLAKLQIPLPPLSKQHRIAEIARLHTQERRLAEELISAKHALIDSATWQSVVGTTARGSDR